jgi:hypothetical protein
VLGKISITGLPIEKGRAISCPPLGLLQSLWILAVNATALLFERTFPHGFQDMINVMLPRIDLWRQAP